MLGISRDTPAENLHFREKFALFYDLLSDVDGAVSLAYGAIEDTGQHYPARITVLIDPEGRVARVFGEVNPASHPGEILTVLD